MNNTILKDGMSKKKTIETDDNGQLTWQDDTDAGARLLKHS